MAAPVACKIRAIINHWAPGATPTSVDGEPILATPSPAFRAHPSVTRASTEFRWTGRSELAARVEIFDVSGRRVRRLDVPSGESRIAWDGRGTSGAPVASGVYLARLLEGNTRMDARVVVLR